jgi:hypothetical protein
MLILERVRELVPERTLTARAQQRAVQEDGL